jgi:succinoglycan biosynthesis transport protein ExoP
MSLIQFFRILYARRLILLAALLSCLIAAVAMIQVLPKRYVAHARVMLELIKPDPITGQVLSDRRAYTRTQIEIIKDYQIAEKVVDQLGWASNPDIVQQYAQSGASGGENIRRWLAKQVIAGTDAELIETSNILQISFRSSNPDTARRIVTVIRDVYKDASVARQQESAGALADWYAEQTRQAEALVKLAEAERAAFAKSKGIVLQADSTDLESSRLRSLSGQSAIEVVAPGGGMAAASPAQTQLEMINQQIAQAATSLGPNHPGFQALQRQRTALQAAAAREQAASRQTGGPAPGASAARAAAEYERQKQRVVSQSEEIDMINRMTRDIELKREQLAKVADKASEFRLQANSGNNEITLMGDAIAPDTPEFPKIPLILAGALGFGTALGVCLSLLIELLGRRIRGQEDLEYASGVPVFAEVGARARKSNAPYRKLVRYLSDRARRSRPVEAAAE